ncbi:PAS domain S-box-containing protein/diguanylate cyclase (GGDEF) domain-containing protein [Carnobacterium alterfunditum]|uniref:PAS domain S-box-containing protein/diguanylate cyclase (GGDEF) domain-containing protein n=1 Tax=Carnobacterium alterfunditum TaxID=28230 RepID=A0A1N6HPY1_9LACT|nr:HD domain-containing phosphohydrolase [Carnobacterium alterfunditum]SIO21874.1 PAS domain S-box-containing protein/diguanylate cyclase (GGDEF) domain-containing protein [Carnobacterium alterfunditum]
MMEPSFYAEIIQASLNPFVCFELVKDNNNKVIDGIYKDLNPAYECLIGMNKDALLGKKVTEISESINLKTIQFLKASEKAKKNDKTDYYFELKKQFYRIQIFSFEKEYTAISYTESTTELLQKNIAQEDLKQTENQLSLILDSTEEAICGIDLNGRCTFLNLNCMKLLGIKEESEMVGQPIFNHLIKDSLSTEETTVKQDILNKLIGKQPCQSNEIYFIRMDGTLYPVEYFVKPKTSNGTLLGGILTFADMTKRKAEQAEINHLMFHDPLTGSFNHIKFEKLKVACDNEKNLPLSIIMGDVNGLRRINQHYGHYEGDQLLKAITTILRESIPKNGYIARYGEDEFSILLPNTDSSQVSWHIEKIQDAIREYNDQISKDQAAINLALGSETKCTMDYDIQKMINKAQDYMDKQKMLNRDSMRNILLTSIKTTLLVRSKFTEEHAERLVTLSKSVGKKMKLSPCQMDELALLAELHDVGKIGIDDAILNKPGKLTDGEMAEMKKHSFIGYQIIKSIEGLADIALPILHHHERSDGKGYPDGLTRHDIPLLSRIISVVDAYDAMTQDRPYRKAMTQEEAIVEIKKNSGTQFDPEVVRFFLESIEEILKE